MQVLYWRVLVWSLLQIPYVHTKTRSLYGSLHGSLTPLRSQPNSSIVCICHRELLISSQCFSLLISCNHSTDLPLLIRKHSATSLIDFHGRDQMVFRFLLHFSHTSWMGEICQLPSLTGDNQQLLLCLKPFCQSYTPDYQEQWSARWPAVSQWSRWQVSKIVQWLSHFLVCLEVWCSKCAITVSVTVIFDTKIHTQYYICCHQPQKSSTVALFHGWMNSKAWSSLCFVSDRVLTCVCREWRTAGKALPAVWPWLTSPGTRKWSPSSSSWLTCCLSMRLPVNTSTPTVCSSHTPR